LLHKPWGRSTGPTRGLSMNSGCKDTKNHPFYKIFREKTTENFVEGIKNKRLG